MSFLGSLRSILGLSTRSIEAGGNGPRWTAGKAIRSPAREITLRRQLAAERATWLAHNDATAAAIVAAWTGNIVADGPAIAAKTTDDAVRVALAMRFDAWWSRCDAEEIDDLAGMLHRLVRGIVTTGEAFVLLETDEDGELRLRSVDPAQCDATLTRNLPNGRRIVAGIEMDERGRRIAYWFRDAEDMLTAYTIAAGAGVPYELISSNLSEVNFSSARVGLHEFRRRVDTLRRTLLTARFLDPVWRRWLAHEALHGRLSPAIAARLEMTAAWPGWPAIDPLKDAQADQIAIAIGVESRQAIIARRGRDPREVDAEITADTYRPRAVPAAQTEDKPE